MNKIKNNILIKNIFILLISGAVAKVIGMLGKIIYTREAGIEVVSLYSLITPTFMLIITICQFSFPIAVSKLSAENRYDNKKLLITAYSIGFIIDIVLMLFVILFFKTIANLLHNSSLYKAIITIIYIVPLVTISSIQRGFLHGKEDMLGASITNITEEIIKITLIITTLPIALLKSNLTAVITIILYNIITESTNILIMHKSIKKYIDKKKTKLDKKIAKEIFKISLPTTLIRLISSLAFFLEPILLTNILLKDGYTKEYIQMQYGIINSYIIPLLSIPSFFSVSIASALLPNITKAYANKKYNDFKHKLLRLLTLSVVLGSICISIILLFPKLILNLIYGVSFGTNYIYVMGPFFVLLYIQPTLSSALQAMGKTNKLFYVSIISNFLKYLALIIFGILGFEMYSLNIAINIGILTTTLLAIKIVLNQIKKLNN